MALMLRHANEEAPPLGLVREDLPPGVVAWVHAMLAKDPAARPASAAHAWDWLEGVVADELGARWRRAAALPEAGEKTGYVSTVVTALPASLRATGPQSAVLPAASAHASPVPARTRRSRRARTPPSARPRRRPRPRRRCRCRRAAPAPALMPLRRACARAGSDPSAAARARTFTSPHAPPPPPARSPRRPGRHPGHRGRGGGVLPPARWRAAGRRGAEAVARAAGARRRRAGSAREPAGHRRAARARSRATTPTRRSTAPAPRCPSPAPRWSGPMCRTRARRCAARRTTSPSSAIRCASTPSDVDRLGGASARLVSRLERIEPLVPGAADSVGGARKLKAWAEAELAPPLNPAAPVSAGEAPAAAAAARRPPPAATRRRPVAHGHPVAHGDADRHARAGLGLDPGRRPAPRPPARPPPRGPQRAHAVAPAPDRVGCRAWQRRRSSPRRTAASS